ncbi:ubiquinone anaerobic biosynthesis protein UbiU [Teredinibacter purpureus]|nr:peptidase U32 family protein [Teredinibacter purpureus]
MELLCPAGNIPALKSAINNGADAVYIGLKDKTNARNFSGLNFTPEKLDIACNLAHQNKRKLYVAINTFAHPNSQHHWTTAADIAIDAGADALIVADLGLLDYISTRHPSTSLHLSVQASATNAAAINFYEKNFTIERVILPRVLSLQQVTHLAENCTIPIEVFAFGSLCIMSEGRCYLSSYLTGESPNTAGACSPAPYVRWIEKGDVLESRLNNVLIDSYSENENAGYPTLCKGRFDIDGTISHALEEPTSLNTLNLLPQLKRIGIVSLKIEGRQRSPAYVGQVTKVWREAIDMLNVSPDNFSVDTSWKTKLKGLSEGCQTTLGAYEREWQ